MSKASPDVEAAIQAFFQRWGDLIGRENHDLDLVLDLLTDDIDWTMPDQPPMKGKAAVRQHLEQTSGMMKSMGGIKQTGFTGQFFVDPTCKDVKEPGMVVCVGKQAVEIAGKAFESTGSSTFVKVGGQWKLRVIATSNPTHAFLQGLMTQK